MESELMYGSKGEVPEGEHILPIGKAHVARPGKDVTVISFGKIFNVAKDAANALEKEGVDVELIDLRTVRPIDYNTLVESVKKTNRCVIVEESWPLASISSELAYMIQKRAFDYLDAPILRVTGRDTPLPYAPTLIEEYVPNVKRTVQAVKQVMYLN
jgi:pyruvate dehydrogenase E1 component beta subunit